MDRQARGRSTVILAVLAAALSTHCATIPRVPATGTLAGEAVATTVDSDRARVYLEEVLAGGGAESAAAREVESALREVAPDPYDRESLRRLSERLSLDAATIFFVAALYEQPANRRVQDAFHALVEQLAATGGEFPPPAGHQSYLLAFVPGYAYRKDPTTGADFARQREILGQRGFRITLIETEELGTVEENADIVAAAVRRFAALGERMILISTSKGGPEAALALGERLAPEDAAAVEAWISVGGLLRGSPYADRFLSWPMRWLVKVVLALRGLNPRLLRNLSTRVRRPAFAHLELPARLLAVHYVGVPLSGHVGSGVGGRYKALRALGPNDGLTLLADELVPGGMVVTDLGLDHYYRDPLIDLKTVALAYLVVGELEAGAPGR